MDRAPEDLLLEIDRLRAELAQAKREAFAAGDDLHARVVEALPAGVFHISADGRFLAVNAAAARVLGIDRDVLLRMKPDYFAPATIRDDGSPCPVSEYPVWVALRTGEPAPPTTIGIPRPDGDVAWAVFSAVPVVDAASGAVASAIVTCVDITQQKRIEALLRESEARLLGVLESAPNPIGATDRDGTVLFMNRTAPNLRMDQVVGRPAWEFVTPEDQPRAREALRATIERGTIQEYEVTGGSGRRYAVRIGPLRGGPEIVGTIFASWDVTEQRELEAHLTIADRMASIGALAAGVAHGINNPLTFVLSHLERLERDLARDAPPSVDLCAAAASALEGARRIRGIVADLSTFSHVGGGDAVELDVRRMLDSALQMAENEIRCRARLVRDYRPTPPVLANDSRLGQVFVNLVVNAAQAIAEGSIEDNEIRVSTSTDAGGRVVIAVSDTGAGIPAALIDKVFDPFVTTKPPGVGTGLGLHIARSIVTSLGGEIEVESTVGVGTTFRVKLPPAPRAGGPSSAPPAPRDGSNRPGARTRPLRILVVDDEPPIAAVMAALLEEHDVVVAHSGREAIERLSSASFDLVFCDLLMPDLTGMDVYEHVRSAHPGRESSLVFMTGGAFTRRAREFLRDVDNERLDKPFESTELFEIVASHAARRR
jgi:PAS domain S-box-containing protein